MKIAECHFRNVFLDSQGELRGVILIKMESKTWSFIWHLRQFYNLARNTNLTLLSTSVKLVFFSKILEPIFRNVFLDSQGELRGVI